MEVAGHMIYIPHDRVHSIVYSTAMTNAEKIEELSKLAYELQEEIDELESMVCEQSCRMVDKMFENMEKE